MQKHLSDKTNELFDIQDTLIIHDLTNTYFEGEKRSSKLAKFGRSKEKRTDAKLIVLALVINPYGFIKYSCVHEGNYADTSNLNSLLDKLNSSVSCHNPLVVMDAGIATQENLNLVVSKGFHYLCVSRKKPKEIIYDKTKLTTYYETKKGGEIILRSLQCDDLLGNFLEVKSKGKELKEQSMNNQFINRFTEEIENIINR